jgi:hypothetical protein
MILVQQPMFSSRSNHAMARTRPICGRSAAASAVWFAMKNTDRQVRAWDERVASGGKKWMVCFATNDLRLGFFHCFSACFPAITILKNPEMDGLATRYPSDMDKFSLQYLRGSWNCSRGSTAEGLAEESILSPFAEAPRKRLCIIKVMMGNAQRTYPWRRIVAEAPRKCQPSHISPRKPKPKPRKPWRKRIGVERNRQRVLNTAQMRYNEINKRFQRSFYLRFFKRFARLWLR